MEERKPTNKTPYSTARKRIRGLFCMIAFCAFVTGMVFTICGVASLGKEVLFVPNKDYFDSTAYQVDISNEITSLLNDLNRAYVSGIQDSFSITDVATEKIYYYDLQEIVNTSKKEEISITKLRDLKRYMLKSREAPNVYSYQEVLQYLASDDSKNNYIYLDNARFKRFFWVLGQRNTEHRFSKDFSVSAWFLFEDNQLLREIEKAEMAAQKEEDILTDLMGNTYGEDDTDDETGSDNSYSMNYAVYDPASGVFYSTLDDYFNPMGSYVYDAREVAAWAQDIQYQNADSIIFPLLKSMNYGISGLWDQIYARYNDTSAALARLSEYDDSGLLYYIKNSKFEQTNVENVEEIADLTYTYRMDGGDATISGSPAALTDAAKWEIGNAFSCFPSDTVFYFGIDTSRNQDDISEVVSNSRLYKRYAVRTKCFAALAVIAFILLVIQAVWLIRATGRVEKGDKEIVLNRFDKLPTEIWLAAYAGFLVVFYIGVAAVGDMVLEEANVKANITALAGWTVLRALPYAFLFMMLALSLTRRIKAHNLWTSSYVQRLGGLVGDRFKEVYDKLESTKRFLIAFVGYEVVGGICVILLFTPTRTVGIGILILLQIVAAGFILYITKDMETLIKGVKKITEGDLNYKTAVNEEFSLFKDLSEGINHIGDGLKAAVETSLKDERMKTELITNVSHDLKTPLTSIINYINLLKTEKMPTNEAEHYIEVLDGKAQRLRQLTEDLVEAAKVNTGNIELEKMPLAFDELMKQAIGEFEDKFATKNLIVIARYPEEPAVILADGRRMFRIMENVLQNAYKYAMEGTRIYADLSNEEGVITFILKNISAAQLNISPEELMERFTRGDSARTTEGSGLGLSIAKDLTKLQDGNFDIRLDGDLFKVIITFYEYQK